MVMRFPDLDGWLAWQQSLYSREIDLTLDRLIPVYERMSGLATDTTVITVAGTNGKGSCVAVLESLLGAAGRTVAAYSSPHLYRYNERIRLGGEAVPDKSLIAAFEAVEDARRTTPLTYFEFGTLAALEIISRYAPEFAVLEVGLGGRLDAVNIVDSDVAVITTIGLDHQAWLGESRDAIAGEKAGIIRQGRPVVIGDRQPPRQLLQIAAGLEAPMFRLGLDFEVERRGDRWDFKGSQKEIQDMPVCALNGPLLDNAACAFESLSQLDKGLIPSGGRLERALGGVSIPARLQRVIDGDREWMIDLAHNEPAARVMADYLAGHPVVGQTRVVLGLVKDKDAKAIVSALRGVVDHWILVDLEGDRGRTAENLRDVAFSSAKDSILLAGDVAAGCQLAESLTTKGDRILVMGSFLVAGPALARLGLGDG
jgi:dihydrofolate synthase/folylpolyglutamate synthase